MKAWEIHAGRLNLHDVQLARPAAGEVAIQVSHAGICGSDLPKLVRPDRFALPEPWRPGHEIVGADPDKRVVVIDPLVPCQGCLRCAAGDTHLCPDLRRLGWDLPGGLAEQVVVPAANVHGVPVDLDPLHAVLADPAAVAVHGLRCHLMSVPERLAVIGAGAIGLLTALYAHQRGWAVTVVHRTGRPPHPAVLEAIPATFRAASTLPDEHRYDAVVDAATGDSAGPLELALRLVRDGGTVIVQNAYHPGVQLTAPLRDLFRRSVLLVGSFSYCRRRRPDDFGEALALLGDHPNQISHLVTEAGGLTDLPTVLADPSPHPARRVLRTPTPARGGPGTRRRR